MVSLEAIFAARRSNSSSGVRREVALDHLERRLELVLVLGLAQRRELGLGHHLMFQHHLEIGLALGLVLEVEGLHFVLQKHVGLA